MLSMPLLLFVLAVAGVMVVFAPFYLILPFDLSLMFFVGQWDMGGIRFDPTDLLLGSLLVALLLRARLRPDELWRGIPHLVPWLILLVFMTLSYANMPENRENLTSPVRIVYQLSRYCLKPLIYYPLCVLLLRGFKQVQLAFTAIVVGALACALLAIKQGYSGVSAAAGPFGWGNEFAGVLIVPMVICLSWTLFPKGRWQFLASLAALGIFARALLFSASRGGMVAILAAFCVFLGFAFLTPLGRMRLMRLAPLAVLAPIALFIVRPDFIYRPSVQHALSSADGTKASTMRWRMTERWPLFLAKAMEAPWLGTGTAVDKSLGDDANTPHNGYIALAVRNGFVVPSLYLYFFLRLHLNAWKTFRRRTKDLRERILAVTAAAAVTGLMLHNMVESTFTINLILKFFWVCCAVGALTARSDVLSPVSAEEEEEDEEEEDEETAEWTPPHRPPLPGGARG